MVEMNEHMVEVKEMKRRRYIFTLKLLRERLGMKGYPKVQRPTELVTSNDVHEFRTVDTTRFERILTRMKVNADNTRTTDPNTPNLIETVIERTYLFSTEQLCTKLDMEGIPVMFGLWCGRSPKDEEDGISDDIETWFFDCEEGSLE